MSKLHFATLAVSLLMTGSQADAQLLTATSQLYNLFDAPHPELVPVTGLGAGETLLAIDERRANAGLYGITATRLYSINKHTAVATAISPVGAFSLTGSSFDMEAEEGFVRIITGTGQNIRVDYSTGLYLGSDAPFAYRVGDPNAGRKPNVVAIADHTYYGGLYGVDADLDTWVSIDEASGLITTKGSFGFDISEDAGFDFSGGTGHAELITNPGGSSGSVLYEFNVFTKHISSGRILQGGYKFIDLSAGSAPEPATWAMMLLGFGALGVVARRSARQQIRRT